MFIIIVFEVAKLFLSLYLKKENAKDKIKEYKLIVSDVPYITTNNRYLISLKYIWFSQNIYSKFTFGEHYASSLSSKLVKSI